MVDVPADRIRRFVLVERFEAHLTLRQDFIESHFWNRVAREFAEKLREHGKIWRAVEDDGRVFLYTDLEVVVPRIEDLRERGEVVRRASAPARRPGPSRENPT